MTFQSILCPVDFSRQSHAALQHAIALARRFDGRLTVLFVNDPLLLAAARAARGGTSGFVDRADAELARFVRRAGGADLIDAGNVALVTSVGNPADEILRQARRLRSDIIVIGSQGLSGIPRVFFGSTTEQVLRKAPVPVLAMAATRRSRGHARSPLTIDRVIAPIDLAGDWQPDAAHAADLARQFGAHLLLVHVVARVQTPPWLRAARRSDDRRRVEKAKKALEHVKTKLLADSRSLTTVVVLGEPAPEIARLARRRRSLVVMSLRGTAGIFGLRRGAVAYRVITRTSTPVLALPRRRLGGRLAVRARKAITDALTARDRAEIAGMDALLSVVEGKRR